MGTNHGRSSGTGPVGGRVAITLKQRTSSHPWMIAALGIAIVGAYAWWATGRPPFTLSAYLAVSLAAAVLLIAWAMAGGFSARRSDVKASYRDRSGQPRFATLIP